MRWLPSSAPCIAASASKPCRVRASALRHCALSPSTCSGTVGADEEMRTEAARRFDASPIAGGPTPIPADIEVAILAVVAQLLRPGDYETVLSALPICRDAARGDALARGAVGLPRRRALPADLRPGYDRGAEPKRVRCPRAHFWPTRSDARRSGTGSPNSGTRSSSASPRTRRSASSKRFRRSVPMPNLPNSAIAFLRAHPLSSGPRRVAQSIERLQVNVAFAARERSELARVLSTATGPS